VVISIRPHQIELVSGGELARDSSVNVIGGTVLRASFLGDSVDYQVKLADGEPVLRVAGPTPPRARAGEGVTLRIPAAACIPLPEDEPPRDLRR
jgi:hypothetical protein